MVLNRKISLDVNLFTVKHDVYEKLLCKAWCLIPNVLVHFFSTFAVLSVRRRQ